MCILHCIAFFFPEYILSLVINSYYKNVDLPSGYLYYIVSYCINCIIVYMHCMYGILFCVACMTCEYV